MSETRSTLIDIPLVPEGSVKAITITEFGRTGFWVLAEIAGDKTVHNLPTAAAAVAKALDLAGWLDTVKGTNL